MKAYVYKNLYINTYSSSIYNHQQTVNSELPFNSWMDQQTEVHPYNGILLGNEKERTI